jgi:hypothetical protein
VLQTAQRFLAFLLILALAGAVAWLLAQVHAKTFAVEQHESDLWIVRGRELPLGFAPYRPADKVLAQAYAPIPLVGDSPGELLNAPFDDRDALDQALFRTFKGWIEARLESDDNDRLAQAIKLLKRAELLTGISAEQRDQLKDLKAKGAYVEGRARLEEAEVALREAVGQLKLAAETRTRYSREAGDLYERTSALAEQLSRAVRNAGTARPPEEPKRDPNLPAEKTPPGLTSALDAGGVDSGADAPAPADAGDTPDASAAPPSKPTGP